MSGISNVRLYTRVCIDRREGHAFAKWQCGSRNPLCRQLRGRRMRLRECEHARVFVFMWLRAKGKGRRNWVERACLAWSRPRRVHTRVRPRHAHDAERNTRSTLPTTVLSLPPPRFCAGCTKRRAEHTAAAAAAAAATVAASSGEGHAACFATPEKPPCPTSVARLVNAR